MYVQTAHPPNASIVFFCLIAKVHCQYVCFKWFLTYIRQQRKSSWFNYILAFMLWCLYCIMRIANVWWGSIRSLPKDHSPAITMIQFRIGTWMRCIYILFSRAFCCIIGIFQALPILTHMSFINAELGESSSVLPGFTSFYTSTSAESLQLLCDIAFAINNVHT